MEIIGSDTPDRAAPAAWFTGDARFAAIETPAPGAAAELLRVSFAPGARTVWHSHPHGQVLVILNGEGRVQTKGGPMRAVAAGDVIHIAPGECHWHGAAPDSAMTHLALETWAGPRREAVPGPPVTD